MTEGLVTNAERVADRETTIAPALDQHGRSVRDWVRDADEA